ncbi:transposase [Dehalogenimonas etheniformans]|uniref:Transposase InsH N-terminal domain-containing protein n=1 Tax=Dehalogenimonas etheniformans TaxID=1536648 RepID=A0A2P5P846_9CHLR|nr:hypothetical protein JP09_004250 [Dehalogenimonas etheniformans]QNT75855.2 transposase [Dehalogenimonas etheniformans]
MEAPHAPPQATPDLLLQKLPLRPINPPRQLLPRIDQVVDFSFVTELVKDRYTPDFGKPTIDPEFMMRLCLLQYLYEDSDHAVIENAKVNLAYKFFLTLPWMRTCRTTPPSVTSGHGGWARRSSWTPSSRSPRSASMPGW